MTLSIINIPYLEEKFENFIINAMTGISVAGLMYRANLVPGGEVTRFRYSRSIVSTFNTMVNPKVAEVDRNNARAELTRSLPE